MRSEDYIVEIESIGSDAPKSAQGRRENGSASKNRPWLSMMWRCCSVYSRVYRNRTATAYEGVCPKCGRRVRVAIGPGGTSHRFFEAS